jgi:hypothetical protein
MARITVAGLLIGLFILCPQPARVAGDHDKATKGAPEFHNRFVGVTFKRSGDYSSTLLKGVEVRRLGGRDFLVGESAQPEREEYADWKGVVFWLPLENIEALMVFDDLAQAIRISEAARKQAEKQKGR